MKTLSKSNYSGIKVYSKTVQHFANNQLSFDSFRILFFSGDGIPRGGVAKVLHCDFVVNELDLQSSYYVHFRTDTLTEKFEPPHLSQQ